MFKFFIKMQSKLFSILKQKYVIQGKKGNATAVVEDDDDWDDKKKGKGKKVRMRNQFTTGEYRIPNLVIS